MALGKNLKKQSGYNKDIPEDKSDSEGSTQAREHAETAAPDEQINELRRINESVAESSDYSGDNLMLIVFVVEKEEYALPIEMVSEIVKTPPIANIPQVPDYVKGVANVRGNVITILDAGLRMGQSSDLEKLPSHLMVIKSDEYSVAIGIDQVPNTLMVNRSEIDHSSELMLHSALDEIYIKGIVKKEQRMIILIDILEMVANQSFAE